MGKWMNLIGCGAYPRMSHKHSLVCLEKVIDVTVLRYMCGISRRRLQRIKLSRTSMQVFLTRYIFDKLSSAMAKNRLPA